MKPHGIRLFYSKCLKLFVITFALVFFNEFAFAQPLDSCQAVLGKVQTSALYNGDGSSVVTPINKDQLNVTLKDGSRMIPMKSENPFIDSVTGKLREYARAIYEAVLGRTPEEQDRINNALTNFFGRVFGMGFKDKKGDPFYVKVNGIPVSITEAQFKNIVKASERVAQINRHILQVLMSKKNPTPDDFNLPHLRRDQVQYIIDEAKKSPYYDPASIHKANTDYSFVAVVGVDLTLGNLNKHLPHQFEINTGTPSGLSNATLLLEAIRLKDPKLFASLHSQLTKNQTFSELRATMDAHGKQMIEDGLSVMTGPGIFNGAHPDVSMISHFTGMPLVDRADIFFDEVGQPRLARRLPINAAGEYELPGSPGEPPRKIKHVGPEKYKGYVQIWSVYGRMEEGHFLQENTSKKRRGLGYKIPDNVEINQKLQDRFKFQPPLILGTEYQYIKNKEGEVTDVVVDKNNRPLIRDYFDQFADDPVNKNNKIKSPLKGLHSRKFFLSNFGTRLIDHKGITSLVVQQARAEFAQKNPDLNPDLHIVSPPPELDDATRHMFFENPRNYVVKVPDESGGVGVYILPMETDIQVQEVIDLVRANPKKYVIQSLADFRSLVTVSTFDGKKVYTETAFDARTFMFLKPDGTLSSDPHAILVRAAKYGSLSTNTSQGAQYGLIAVVRSRATSTVHYFVDKVVSYFNPEKSALPPASITVIPGKQLAALHDFLQKVDTGASGGENTKGEYRKVYLDNFWNSARLAMGVLGPHYSLMIDVIERAQRGEIKEDRFQKICRAMQERIFNSSHLPAAEEVVYEHYTHPTWALFDQSGKLRRPPFRQTREFHIEDFLASVDMLANKSEFSQGTHRAVFLENFLTSAQELASASYIPPRYLEIIPALELGIAGKLHDSKLHSIAVELRKNILADKKSDLLKQAVDKHYSNPTWAIADNTNRQPLDREQKFHAREFLISLDMVMNNASKTAGAHRLQFLENLERSMKAIEPHLQADDKAFLKIVSDARVGNIRQDVFVQMAKRLQPSIENRYLEGPMRDAINEHYSTPAVVERMDEYSEPTRQQQQQGMADH